MSELERADSLAPCSFSQSSRHSIHGIKPRAIPNLVFSIVGVMHLAYRVFKVFDHPDMDLTRFAKQRIFFPSVTRS
jgi:hypothetical protein